MLMMACDIITAIAAIPRKQSIASKRLPLPKLCAPPSNVGGNFILVWMVCNTSASLRLNIAALPEPERSQAQIEWDYASEFRRLHPLIVKLIPILGLTDEQVDPVWESHSLV
jgi:hypothetical protein